MTLFTQLERRVLTFITLTIVIGGITGIVRRYWIRSGKTAIPMVVLRTPQDTTALLTSTENNHLEKTTKPPDEFININLANRKELESLPTIGPVTAKRIIEFRKANGPFKSTDELKKIKGIGEKTLEKIRPYISL